jgi:hypothetical protein
VKNTMPEGDFEGFQLDLFRKLGIGGIAGG